MGCLIMNFSPMLVLLLLCASRLSGQTSQLPGVHWLPGTWRQANDKLVPIETWQKTSDYTLTGTAVKIETVNSDTLFQEQSGIFNLGQGTYYLANDLPVRFKLKQISKNHLVFENPGHDFP